jgi:cellulose synthase/poly-beta-1,6-N-acetylglucosamine synthase-like glycosyltransferase
MTQRHIIKYLQNYAEPLIKSLAEQASVFEGLTFDHVVVIPAYKESSEFMDRFINSSLAQLNVLVIVVVNQPDYDLDTKPQQVLYDHIKKTGELVTQHNTVTLVKPFNVQCHICIIDAFTVPIPEQQGVGLARKLGADFAVYLNNNNQITSQWIHSTDADATLPNNYFSALNSNTSATAKDTVAVSYNFSHQCDNQAINNANQAYEKALRYYVAGMAHANSHYAFFTIGSVIAFKASEYVKVRGFPKRSAGEDFYLLNKLAKLGRIGFVKESVVLIEARESNRVPFGTGPTVSKIMELNRNGLPYNYYNPQLFTELKACLAHFDSLWQQRCDLADWLQQLSPESQKSLLDNQFESFVSKQKSNNQTQFNKQLLVWFDAFKTLKYLHSLRDNGYPDIPLSEALHSGYFSI